MGHAAKRWCVKVDTPLWTRALGTSGWASEGMGSGQTEDHRTLHYRYCKVLLVEFNALCIAANTYTWICVSLIGLCVVKCYGRFQPIRKIKITITVLDNLVIFVVLFVLKRVYMSQ